MEQQHVAVVLVVAHVVGVHTRMINNFLIYLVIVTGRNTCLWQYQNINYMNKNFDLSTCDIFKDNDNLCYQVRTKTASFAIGFDNENKEAIFLKIVKEIQRKPKITLKELKKKIVNNDEDTVIEVLTNLEENQLLPSHIRVSHEKEDNFISSNNTLKKAKLTIIGEGKLAIKLYNLARKSQLKEVDLLNSNNELKLELTIKQSDFIIVDANNWTPYQIELINKIALKYNKPWLHVGGIEGDSLKIGPLFYGQSTGCYNCLISRIKSNNEHPTFLHSYENYLRENKISSQEDIIPNAELFMNIIANIALVETMKFIIEWSLPTSWRTVLNINIFNMSFAKHRLLKKPYCEICNPKLEYNTSPWLETITLK